MAFVGAAMSKFKHREVSSLFLGPFFLKPILGTDDGANVLRRLVFLQWKIWLWLSVEICFVNNINNLYYYSLAAKENGRRRRLCSTQFSFGGGGIAFRDMGELLFVRELLLLSGNFHIPACRTKF